MRQTQPKTCKTTEKQKGEDFGLGPPWGDKSSKFGKKAFAWFLQMKGAMAGGNVEVRGGGANISHSKESVICPLQIVKKRRCIWTETKNLPVMFSFVLIVIYILEAINRPEIRLVRVLYPKTKFLGKRWKKISSQLNCFFCPQKKSSAGKKTWTIPLTSFWPLSPQVRGLSNLK